MKLVTGVPNSVLNNLFLLSTSGSYIRDNPTNCSYKLLVISASNVSMLEINASNISLHFILGTWEKVEKRHLVDPFSMTATSYYLSMTNTYLINSLWSYNKEGTVYFLWYKGKIAHFNNHYYSNQETVNNLN